MGGEDDVGLAWDLGGGGKRGFSVDAVGEVEVAENSAGSAGAGGEGAKTIELARVLASMPGGRC